MKEDLQEAARQVRGDVQPHQSALPAHPGQTASAATSAAMEALVKSAYTAALMRPRSMAEVRERLFAECRRPTLAAKCTYKLKWITDTDTGKPVEGANIRLAEAAFRAMGNLWAKVLITYDDDQARHVEVIVIDLERNLPMSDSIVVEKTKEVSKLRDGQTMLSRRTNSEGNLVYIVHATDDDVRKKQARLSAMAFRNIIWKLFPSDIREEALEVAKATSEAKDKEDPAAAARGLADAFGKIGITTRQLADLLGHPCDSVTPTEARDLRGIYSMVVGGEATWEELVKLRTDARNGKSDDDGAPSRMSMLSEIAAQRVRQPAAYTAALTDLGLTSQSMRNVEDAVLAKIIAHMKQARNARTRESMNANGAKEPLDSQVEPSEDTAPNGADPTLDDLMPEDLFDRQGGGN